MESIQKIAQQIFQSDLEFEQTVVTTDTFKFLLPKLELIWVDDDLPLDNCALLMVMHDVYYASINTDDGAVFSFSRRRQTIFRNINELDIAQINELIAYLGIFPDTTFYSDDDYIVDEAYNRECLSILNYQNMLATTLNLMYEKYSSLVATVLLLNMSNEEWAGCLGLYDSFVEPDSYEYHINHMKTSLKTML